MDHGDSLVVLDHTDLEWLSRGRRADVQGDGRVISFERPPVVADCVEDVGRR